MKRIVLVLVLAAVIVTGTAFADHPDGFGIGVKYQYGLSAGDFGGSGYGLLLNIPKVPIFWGLNFGFGTNWLRFGLTGDYYLLDMAIAKDAGLHWYLGLGGFFSLDTWTWNKGYLSEYGYLDMNFGVRVPIGLSWQPIPLLDIFIEVAPSLGMYIYGDRKYKNSTYVSNLSDRGEIGFYWGVPLAVGIRFWF